jgi:acetoin utilization protein AcuB
MLQTLFDPSTAVDGGPRTRTGWEEGPLKRPSADTVAEEPRRVRDLMSTAPVTIPPDMSVYAAHALMQERRIEHLPVVEDGRLVGMVSNSDIQLALPSPATSFSVGEIHHLFDKLTVREIMTRFVVTVAPTLPVTTAVSRMLRHRVGALPVTENQRVIGILTRSDVLRAFLRLQEQG